MGAIALANQSCYGLGGGVWTEKAPLAYETALSIKTGTVWINCYNLFDAAAGFGGYKESGFGREGGKEGLYQYLKPQKSNRVHDASLQSPLTQAEKDPTTWATDTFAQRSLPTNGTLGLGDSSAFGLEGDDGND